MNPAFERKDISSGMTIWSHAGIAVVIDTPDPAWPPRLVAGYERRVEAQLLGRCPCGAVLDEVTGVAPRQARGRMVHEADCDASDDRLAALLSDFARHTAHGQDTIRPKRKRRN